MRQDIEKIAFFDSGMGGLTVLQEALHVLPHENYLYFADSQHAPYGNKPKEEIKRLVSEAVAFMVNQSPLKALVIACNTATSVVIEDLRQRYAFPVIGMEPAIKPALALAEDGRVLVFATEMTLKEKKFLNLVTQLDTQHQIDYLPLQALVGMAERFEFDEATIINYLKNQTQTLDLQVYKAVVLGCTHFPYFKKYIQQLLPHATLIDGSEGTVKRLKNLLGNNTVDNGGCVEYYISGQMADSEQFERYLSELKEKS